MFLALPHGPSHGPHHHGPHGPHHHGPHGPHGPHSIILNDHGHFGHHCHGNFGPHGPGPHYLNNSPSYQSGFSAIDEIKKKKRQEQKTSN